MKKMNGILLCFSIALVAYYLGQQLPIISAPIFAILIGIIISAFIKDKSLFAEGISFTSKKILQWAVILLGLGLNLQTILIVGSTSLPIIISTVCSALICAYFVSKQLKLPAKMSVLIGVGSSICGGSAIAATAPVIEASDDDIAQAISVIFTFNILAAFVFPSLGHLLQFSNEGFAIFAGTAVNDTSSVTAVSSIWDTQHGSGTTVLDMATIVKLTRTLAIIPITIGLSLYRQKTTTETSHIDVRKSFPTFIIYFVLASVLTTVISSLPLDESTAHIFHTLFSYGKLCSKFFIIMALAGIGLNTNVSKLLKSGKSSLLLGFSCWMTISLVSIILQKICHIF